MPLFVTAGPPRFLSSYPEFPEVSPLLWCFDETQYLIGELLAASATGTSVDILPKTSAMIMSLLLLDDWVNSVLADTALNLQRFEEE